MVHAGPGRNHCAHSSLSPHWHFTKREFLLCFTRCIYTADEPSARMGIQDYIGGVDGQGDQRRSRASYQTDHPNLSRWKLEGRLDLPILTFAYPFGAYDEDSVFYAHYAGYIAAMGLGAETLQGEKNLFYLYRRDIKGSYDLSAFASFLPWQGDLDHLFTATMVP